MSKTGTFLVTAAEAESAVVRDVADGQVHTLASNPGVEAGDVLSATLAPEPPLEAVWHAESIEERRSVAVERVDERPADAAYDAVEGRETGDLAELEPASDEVAAHALVVPVADTDDAVEDVLDDETTLARAARLGTDRVVVRGADGVVTVRYSSGPA